MFENAEEKAAKKQARDEEQARVAAAQATQAQAAADEKRRRAWSLSAPGGAAEAKVAGDEFYQCQLQVGTHSGNAVWGEASGQRGVQSPTRNLAEIEALGWRLENADHVYMVTGQTSTDKVFISGENTAVTGVIVGVYLFRNDRSIQAPPDAGPPATFGTR
jgi:hypothetical protein